MAKRTTTPTSSNRGAPRKTATRKTPAATSATRARAHPKTAPAPAPLADPAAPRPKLVTSTQPVVAAPELKKKELIDTVVERSGIKKKDAKPVVEALLAVLGEAIGEGRELNLQPLGKLRINRTEDKGNGRVIVCKLRQSLQQKNPVPVPLAEPAE